MEQGFAVRDGFEARGAVGHEAFALRGADFAAEVRFSRQAELAFATFGGAGGGVKLSGCFLFLLVAGWRGDLGGIGCDERARSLKCDDIVARFHARNTLADGLNNACAFMTEDDGEGAFRVFA